MYVPKQIRQRIGIIMYLLIVGALLVTGIWKQSTPDVVAALVLVYITRVFY